MALDLPLPGARHTRERWAALAALGRYDLALARLAEGHVDALAILAEAGRTARPDALYGVWAARSGGTGPPRRGRLVTGTVRFCSGATVLDRALVAASAAGRHGLGCSRWTSADPAVRRDPDSWQAIGMDASDSLDVQFADVHRRHRRAVGEADWYVCSRRGFRLGSGGVAAVWLGGTAGVLDSVLALLRDAPHVDEHQSRISARCTRHCAPPTRCSPTPPAPWTPNPTADPTVPIRTAKSAVERAAWDTPDRVPRITGPTPLCRDRRFAQQLADLEVYVRQHHAERDLAVLGEDVLDGERYR